MTTLLRAATRIDERGEEGDAWVLLDGDRIAAVGSGAAPDAAETIDLGDAILVPGFIDLHGHGAGGHAYDDGGEELAAALAAHRAHGTTRSVISIVTNPLAELRERLAEVAAAHGGGPLVLGSHLEGRSSAERRGAHNPSSCARRIRRRSRNCWMPRPAPCASSPSRPSCRVDSKRSRSSLPRASWSPSGTPRPTSRRRAPRWMPGRAS
ncbi:MAG: hypothetical protein R2717_00225 [Schumannella sp.]